MCEKLLNGKEISALIRSELKKNILKLKQNGINPKISVVLVGDDPASIYYAKSKKKAADNIGIDFDFHNLSNKTTEIELIELIEILNNDDTIHGIMIELPLPKHINSDKIMKIISPLKDIDGINPINKGYILTNGSGLFPATPQSCIELMLRSGVKIEGKHVVIVGRGETVGKPLVFLLLKYNPTITICHSKTVNLSEFIKKADIVIAAVGKPKMITKDMVKKGAIVVDAGINQLEDGRYCGDVDFEEVKKNASLISPVPGGVGSLTTVLLFKNLLKAIKLQKTNK